jgi:hypothetical protein
MPPERFAEPNTVPPFWNCTVPVADEGLTTATNVTDPPISEGFGVELNDTVVAFRTV